MTLFPSRRVPWIAGNARPLPPSLLLAFEYASVRIRTLRIRTDAFGET